MMAGKEYKPIAGGTDLIPQLRFGKPKDVLDIADLGLNFINGNNGYVEIGAACSHTTIATDKIIKNSIPLVGIASSLVGSRQIRNRGTIGGNIINASPCADTVPALLIYDAELILISKKGRRQIKLSEFTTQPYVTDRTADELLFSILCKKEKLSTGHSYIKLGRRQAVNISRMTVSASVQKSKDNIIKDIRLAGGSVFPVTSRITELENMLIGQKISSKLFEDAGEYAAELMIKKSGYRWSTAYKKPVITGLIKNALEQSVMGKSKE
jgi:CO/xanthine dehydrogenase FAD-binding subunit